MKGSSDKEVWMTQDQIQRMSDAFTQYLTFAGPCLGNRKSRVHLATYARGLLSDLPRKSVEPMALAAGCAVRTLQEFLANYKWDHRRLKLATQHRVVAERLPAPGTANDDDGLGVIGLIDETSVVKKGDKTPGVQRQHCGASGKIDNCIVTVHLAVRHGTFLAMLDSELYLPEESWHNQRARCQAAHIPDEVVYRPKWKIALEQIQGALSVGVRFDWLTFDEGYGGKPDFLRALQTLGLRYVCEVPSNTQCWSTYPRYRSPTNNYVAKSVQNVARYAPAFTRQPWRTVTLHRQTLGPQRWDVKAAQVYLLAEGNADRPHLRRPTDGTFWLIVARNPQTGDVKYFLSNAPPKTRLATLLKVAFSRWGVEHMFRLAKSEIGFDHYEGRTYQGLIRHMILCQWVLLFVAEQTDRLRGGKCGSDDGADGPRAQRDRTPMACAPTPPRSDSSYGLGDQLPPTAQPRRSEIPTDPLQTAVVAL
jgi:SRSO17 transposase